MNNIRLFYKKTGRMKFVSHLDMNRFFIRALRKTKLPVWYTEGFNKRVYINFALPLSLGYESLYEVVDFKLTEDIPLNTIEELFKEVLPKDIEVIKATYPIMQNKDIAFAEYTVAFYNINLINDIYNLFNSPQIMVQKNSKKGETSIDIKPYITKYNIELKEGDTLLTIKLPAGNTLNINPNLIIKSLINNNNTCYTVTRNLLLNKDDKIFE